MGLNIKRREGECTYCYRLDGLLYGVNLKADNKFSKKTDYICYGCKQHLIGLFRYDKTPQINKGKYGTK